MAHAPFDEETLAQLQDHQRDKGRHPYTCNGGLDPRDHAHDHEVVMTVTQRGLLCPECGRLQTWA